MKKIISIVSCALMICTLSFTSVMACDGPECQTISNGAIDVSSAAGSITGDIDVQGVYKGGAIGTSVAGGGAAATADGAIKSGEISGDVGTIGGGLSTTEADTFDPGVGDLNVGVGTSSWAQGVAGATADVSVDGKRGNADADIVGLTGQATGNVSGLGLLFGNGITVGKVGQGSVGGFVGDADARVGWFNGNTDAHMDANITMIGTSDSSSYRFIDWEDGNTTVGQGSMIGATTNVTTSASTSDHDRGWCAYADADLAGAYVAAGNGTTVTVQDSSDRNSVGGAIAGANGSYVGAGCLNTNYSGSLEGYSNTQVTKYNGLNGSINSSSAGMTVTTGISYDN